MARAVAASWQHFSAQCWTWPSVPKLDLWFDPYLKLDLFSLHGCPSLRSLCKAVPDPQCMSQCLHPCSLDTPGTSSGTCMLDTNFLDPIPTCHHFAILGKAGSGQRGLEDKDT